MRKRLVFLLILLLLTGCGAEADTDSGEVAEVREDAAQYSLEDSVQGYAFNGTAETEAASEADAAAQTDAQYFTILRASNSVLNDTGTTVLYEQYCTPSFTAADTALDGWVDGVLTDIRKEFSASSSNLLSYASDYIKANGTSDFYSYSNYQELGIARHDDRVVSLLSLSYLYSGGAHASSIQTAYNLDLQKQTVLTLEEVIYPDSAEKLSNMVRSTVTEKFASLGEGTLFDDYLDAIEVSMTYGSMTPYWYLNHKGLVIFYNQYELGPYSSGIIKVELPYEELDGILLEEYYPATPGGTGDVVLTKKSSTDAIHITVESEGDTILIGVEGQVYQVQLSTIYWLGETAILKEMIFSANTLTSGDVLEITGKLSEDGRSIAIEFMDGTGDQKIYYIHDYGLSDTP